MINPILNLVNSLKRVRLVRLTVSVVASVFLIFSTACSSANANPPAPSLSGSGSLQKGRENPTELYEPIEPKEGGMNQYSDTDPRRDTRGLGADIKARVDEAERNIQKVDDPEEFAEDFRKGTPLGERVRNITDSVGDAAKNLGEDVTEGTQRGIRNLKANTSNAGDELRNTVDDARENAADLGKDTARSAKRTANELGNNVDNARRDIAR